MILAADGQILSRGIVGGGSSPSTIVLDHVSQKGALLGYYFARGQRNVIVRMGDFRLHGRLSTRWSGTHREWTIQLEPVRAQPGAA